MTGSAFCPRTGTAAPRTGQRSEILWRYDVAINTALPLTPLAPHSLFLPPGRGGVYAIEREIRPLSY